MVGGDGCHKVFVVKRLNHEPRLIYGKRQNGGVDRTGSEFVQKIHREVL